MVYFRVLFRLIKYITSKVIDLTQCHLPFTFLFCLNFPPEVEVSQTYNVTFYQSSKRIRNSNEVSFLKIYDGLYKVTLLFSVTNFSDFLKLGNLEMVVVEKVSGVFLPELWNCRVN